MNKKILKFLAEAGYDTADDQPAALQLLRYFEEEYDVSLLALLEQEWLDERWHADMSHCDFEMLRALMDDGYREDFDDLVARIEACEIAPV